MRGLLGDATEEFIESLDSTTGRVQIQLFFAFFVENKLVSCVSLVLFCWLCVFFALIGMHNRVKVQIFFSIHGGQCISLGCRWRRRRWRGVQDGGGHGAVWRTGVYAQPAVWNQRFQTRATSAYSKLHLFHKQFCELRLVCLTEAEAAWLLSCVIIRISYNTFCLSIWVKPLLFNITEYFVSELISVRRNCCCSQH